LVGDRPGRAGKGVRMSTGKRHPAGGEAFAAVLASDNLKLARRAIDAWNSEDVEAWLETLDPEVELWPAAPDVDRLAYQGHEGAREFLEVLAGEWGFVSLRSESFHASGDEVLALGHLEARGRDSGLRLTSPAAWLIRLRDRKIVCWRVYTDQNEALKAAGLRR
jgi:ketosteroid isomerase-like protein